LVLAYSPLRGSTFAKATADRCAERSASRTARIPRRRPIPIFQTDSNNSPVLGLKRWNLYTTVTNIDGHFTQDETPYNSGVNGETPGANYCVLSNLTGGAFDLLITNGNHGGVNDIEILAK
jgi:hypothetical protein